MQLPVDYRKSNAMSIISTEQLSRRYGRRKAIEGVNLDIRQGDIFGFLGPNGAGKTTTIRLLMGFLQPTLGRASIFGLPRLLAANSTNQARSRLPTGRPATLSVAEHPYGAQDRGKDAWR